MSTSQLSQTAVL